VNSTVGDLVDYTFSFGEIYYNVWFAEFPVTDKNGSAASPGRPKAKKLLAS